MYDGAVLSLRQRTTYAMLLLSLYVVPFPAGHDGADATSSVARIAVAFRVASVGLPEADVTADLTSRVSLVPSVVTAVAWVEPIAELVTWSFAESDVGLDDVSFDDVVVESLPSGQITPGSHAFFEQHPRKPVELQM